VIVGERPNGGHQARAVGQPLTLGNGQLFGTLTLIGLAERVACMPGWALLEKDDSPN
jgi:hypothetical protein